jgi:hypothetical protein
MVGPVGKRRFDALCGAGLKFREWVARIKGVLGQ